MPIDNLESLNRAINRALRVVNEVAVGVASSNLRDRKSALEESTRALAHIDALQRILVAEDPGLEYHYDPKRPPSRLMLEISRLLEKADVHIREGNHAAAEKTLQSVCGLEPPPLVYEMVRKKIDALHS